MLDHRLESLEGRSLLAADALLDGMPMTQADTGATIADEAAGFDDSDMYSFRRGTADDAVYEEAEVWEDGGDHYEWDGGAFADVVDQTGDDESHPWIGMGDTAGETVETVAAEEQGIADAVAVAHDAGSTTAWVDVDDSEDQSNGIDTPDLTDNAGVEVQFSFEGGSEMPSYRDLAL